MRDPIDRLLLVAAVCTVIIVTLVLVAQACPPEGDGGDPDLNRLKNRQASASVQVKAMTVAEVVSLPGHAGKDARKHWGQQQTYLIGRYEATAITVTGYLVGVKQEGKESANCHGDDRDLHLFLADSSDAPRSKAMVVEITPRAHPTSWTLAALRKLVRDGRPVRITGWLLFDQEHASDHKSRATAWEVHPVTGIEIFIARSWRPL